MATVTSFEQLGKIQLNVTVLFQICVSHAIAIMAHHVAYSFQKAIRAICDVKVIFLISGKKRRMFGLHMKTTNITSLEHLLLLPTLHTLILNKYTNQTLADLFSLKRSPILTLKKININHYFM